MKRCVFGAVLLMIMGLGCLWAGACVEETTAPLCSQLEKAKQEALADHWDAAAACAIAAENGWEAHRRSLAAAADHTPLEDIDDLFAQLAVCRRLEKREDFAILCAQLSRRLEAVSNAHTLSWRNFF